ncbi:MAG: lysylphosphatidylglycerol synthase domain-containing protein [Bacteroidota bacterium]
MFTYFCRMPALSDKTKQFLVILAKLLVVGGAFYYIYDRLANNNQLDWKQFTDALTRKEAVLPVIIVLILTVTNRFFEILKWQVLVSTLQNISIWQSTKQVLAAVTLAVFTPNGIGEYGAKALYYKKEQAGKIIFLNLICNGIQMIIAIIAGLTGLIFFNSKYHLIPTTLLILVLLGIVAIAALVFMSRNITIKGYSLKRLFENINKIPKPVHHKNILMALLRYLSITHQHYFIFMAFGVKVPYPEIMAAIAGVYFLGSSLPNFAFTDFAVRGSVAVYFFGMMGVNEWIVVFAATLQWLLNIVLPVSIGSLFVLRFKPANQRAAHPE